MIANRWEEYTPEEIKDLARECERLAERNSELLDLNAELLDALKALRGMGLGASAYAISTKAITKAEGHLVAKVEAPLWIDANGDPWYAQKKEGNEQDV
jgi:hypothetical protein